MNITPKAIEQFKKLLNEENEMSGIRIFKGEGCCSPALHVSPAEKLNIGDKEMLIDTLKFFIEISAEDMLEGVNIDYGQKGFILNGMNRRSTCC
ncbi:MAG: hypothetical protein IPL53_18150 [Ignavibacteria bacterium]|nr:hypothetical protein [Ignavibacteria bacterium]